MIKGHKPMIVLTGPTAVGKTQLSIRLAKAVGGEVLSADSMQVYKHMDIGSAKITPDEMQGIPHHLIDVLEPWEDFNVVIFKKKCEECLDGIYGRGHIPILAGGTGFYIQALLKDVDFEEEETISESDRHTLKEQTRREDMPYRIMLENLAKEKGAAFLHEMLKQVDAASAGAIHENNVKRTIRALEYYQLTGQRISDHNERERQKDSAYRSCYFVLNDAREKLYGRIDQRVEEMMGLGLVDEVQSLKEMGVKRGMSSMQGLGYKEILDYLDGLVTLEEAVYLIKRDTRHFAKRQLTWFRREREVIWIDKEKFGYDEDKMLAFMLEKLRDAGIFAIRNC